ncbi:MAG TPA: NAD-dependent epimerase/dehydratase family protein, partial [Microbacterium sp.]|nr:NAD-dependent epimerase/dehydratase family protein [Microbacterium sp.]
MSRVVVTGGAGRLGRSVVTALADAGHEVVSIDQATLEGLPATQISVDLLDFEAATAAFARIAPEAVVHLAAIAVPGALPDPDIYRINTQLVWSVLQASLEAGVQKMLLASSPTVMGYGSPSGWEPQYLPLDEKHPTAPWNGYGT